MNRHQIRYELEHRALPEWFFEDKGELIEALLHDKNLLYDTIDFLFKEEGMENPYTEEDFDIVFANISGDLKVLKIIFPEPEEAPLCYCSYILFDKTLEKSSYFCIEKGDEASMELPFVCSWTKDRTHVNYGNCTIENKEDFLMCVKIHLENMKELA